MNLKSRLCDLIEPFELMDQLLSMEVLSRRQYDDVVSEKGAAYRRNEALLNVVTSQQQSVKFLDALRRTGQQHVVNFVTQNGGLKLHDYVQYLKVRS